MAEQWKAIIGYEGIYEVSDHGRIRSLSRIVTSRRWIRRVSSVVIKPYPKEEGGYLRLQLHNAGRVRSFDVHQLVAIHFVPNPMSFPEVDHVDTNNRNNRADNLEWVTRQINFDRAKAAGLVKVKLSKESAAEIRALSSKYPRTELAAKFGVSAWTIKEVIFGRIWKT